MVADTVGPGFGHGVDMAGIGVLDGAFTVSHVDLGKPRNSLKIHSLALSPSSASMLRPAGRGLERAVTGGCAVRSKAFHPADQGLEQVVSGGAGCHLPASAC